MSKLSVGGMGTVYRAEHVLIGKLAAVKVLHPELSTDRDIVNRFFNEAKSTTSIKHPGIVEIFDFGYMPSGHAFLVMEFLDGMSLARRCKTGGKMGEGEAAMLLRGVCSALSAAHAKGIVHRDLKPDNIFLVPDPDSAIGERPKVLDFGIAKLTDIGLAGSATKTGAVMGTPTYMSPEQCRGTGDVDHRADLYSIGCIFYELLTGKPPFVNLGAGELIGAHLYVEPPRPSERLPSISPMSEKLIMALLAKNPGHRPQTAKELGQRFQEIAQDQGWITHSSPTGITAPTMPLLTPPPGAATIHDPAFAHHHTVVDDGQPSMPPGMTTPYALTPPQAFVPTADKPTTLSGAASQSVVSVQPRRSRTGLGLAMATAALIAGGTVAFLQLGGSRSSDTAAATSPAAPVPASTGTSATGPALATEPAVVEAKPAANPWSGRRPSPGPLPSPRSSPATEPTPASGTSVAETRPAGAKPVTASSRKPTPVDARPVLKPMPKTEPTKLAPTKPAVPEPDPAKPADPRKPLFETDI